MRCPLLLLLPLLLLGPALAGCGTVTVVSLPPAHAASPQRADLNWMENTGGASTRLVFGVRSFEVTRDGWQAVVSMKNDTDVPFAVGNASLPGSLEFGLMLFATGVHSELETRNAGRALPTLRAAETFAPALPAELEPHQAWIGTISARGPVAAGAWVRVVFGVLFPAQRIEAGQLVPKSPTVPDSLRQAKIPGELSWITDHAYRLKR